MITAAGEMLRIYLDGDRPMSGVDEVVALQDLSRRLLSRLSAQGARGFRV